MQPRAQQLHEAAQLAELLVLLGHEGDARVLQQARARMPACAVRLVCAPMACMATAAGMSHAKYMCTHIMHGHGWCCCRGTGFWLSIEGMLQAVSELVAEAQAAAAAVQEMRVVAAAAGQEGSGGVAAKDAPVAEVPWKWDILRAVRPSESGL
jgi:hypothetical protein